MIHCWTGLLSWRENEREGEREWVCNAIVRRTWLPPGKPHVIIESQIIICMDAWGSKQEFIGRILRLQIRARHQQIDGFGSAKFLRMLSGN